MAADTDTCIGVTLFLVWGVLLLLILIHTRLVTDLVVLYIDFGAPRIRLIRIRCE